MVDPQNPPEHQPKQGHTTEPETPTVEETPHQPMSIILFSDGTGNSSGKLFKTNVWRMYEALDLGPATAGRRRSQIAYYDNGVGTSSFKPWAVISGIFGFGLKRNILSIYRFVCRNYRPGDENHPGDRIYGFGFSRGAFTIRMVIGLICHQGIIRYDTEQELQQRSVDALRRFSRRNNPNFFPFFVVGGRILRDVIISVKQLFVRVSPQPPSYRPDVEFVGVWDTVSAYGGPIAEITRAIDNWIWPLSMTDYHLSPKVKRASHALALDDERDSFHPLLWDEFNESREAADADKEKTKARKAAVGAAAAGDSTAATAQSAKADEAAKKAKWYRSRVQQVWFAGMHSDVGGGYPDESLSFVPLRWMMDQVKTELSFFPTAYKRIEEMSNAFGPIHDSRHGLASYYRYQPRKITAFLHPESQPDEVEARRKARIVCETLSLRDPTLGEQKYRPQGFLLSCKVHESVIARITSGADDYAPIVLPDRFEIVPAAPASPPKLGLYDWHAWKNIEAKGVIDKSTGRSSRGDRQEAIWNYVFFRRLAYFATVALTLLLLSLPLRTWGKAITTDDRWGVWGRLTGALSRLLPDFLDPWIGALRDRPWHVLILLVLVFAARAVGSRCNLRIKDKTHGLWRDSMKPEPLPAVPPSVLRDRRNSYGYQRTVQWVKWWFLPNIIFGPLLILSIAYLLLIAATQFKLSWDETDACAPSANLPAPGLMLKTSEICHPSGIKVQKDHEYTVDFYSDGKWQDGSQPTTPEGLRARDFDGIVTRIITGLAAPLRRVVTARYLEPLYEIRSPKGDRKVAIHIGRLGVKKEGEIYSGAFRARRDGDLFFFVNDAVWIGNMSHFYTHKSGANQGTARIVVIDRTPSVLTKSRVPAAPKQEKTVLSRSAVTPR